MRKLGRATALLGLCVGSFAQGQTVTWNNASGGSFNTASNWSPASVPGVGNTALFGLPATYTVSFATSVQNIVAAVTGGNVTFTGSQQYALSSAVQLSGGSLTHNLSSMISPSLSVIGSSRMTIGSLSTGTFAGTSIGAATGANSFLAVNGGTLVALSGVTAGASGGAGTITFSGASTGSFGPMSLGGGTTAGSRGTLTVSNTSNIDVNGTILVGTGGVATQSGYLRLSDTAIFTQAGSNSLTLGSFGSSAGTMEILGGTFTTGTGPIAVNQTGVLRVGGSGVLNANGDIFIGGGFLDISSASAQLNLAPGRSVELNLATASIMAPLTINNGQTWLAAGSTMTGIFPLSIGVGSAGTLALNSSTFSNSNGAVNITGGGATTTFNIFNASTASFGAITSNIGGGFARFMISSGSTLNAASLNLGSSVASITLFNDAALLVTNQMSLLEGAISISGGAPSRLSTGTLILGANGQITASDGTITIGSGGGVIAGSISISGGQLDVLGSLNLAGGNIDVQSPGKISTLTNPISLTNARLTVPQLTHSSTLSVNASTITVAGLMQFRGSVGTISGASSVGVGGNFDLPVFPSGTTTLRVSDPGTSLAIGGLTRVGTLGEGTLVLTDAAAATFGGGIRIGREGVGSGLGVMSVSNGAIVNVGGNMFVASQVGSGLSLGTLAISSSGQVLMAPGANLTVGASSSTSATVRIDGPAMLSMDPAAIVNLNATGTIIVNGGEARLGTFTGDPAGKVVFTSGTLGTHGVLNVSPAGMFGNALSIGPERALHHGGTFTIANGTAALTGGVLSVGTFGPSANKLNFQSGQLRITGSAGFALEPAGALGSSLSLSHGGMHVAVDNQLTVASSGQLQVSGGSLSAGTLAVNGLFSYSAGSVEVDNLLVGASGRSVVGPSINLNIGGSASNSGRIELAGGIARIAGTGSVSNQGLVVGSGEVAIGLINAVNGELRANAGDTLLISGAFPTNAGRIAINGGRIDLINPLANAGSVDLSGGVLDAAGGLSNSGRITGRGTIRSDSTLANFGTVTLSGGISDINAPTTTNTGRIIITGGGLATFFGEVDNSPGSELRVSTASTAVFMGDVTGASSITGGGLKIFEAGASGLLFTGGDSVVESTGQLNLTHIRERSLTINGGLVAIEPNGTPAGTSRLEELLIAGTPGNWNGQFDLSDNALVIDYDVSSPRATVADYILTGYAAGAWNGSGISSSVAATTANRAIGYAEGSDVGSPAVFAGQPADSTSILARYTLPGDANLDRIVNISDFALLAANFNQPSYWARGDFNYDGITGIGDFALLAANFNQSLPADAARGAAVPEPGAATAFTVLLFATRRRRSDVAAA